MAWTITGSYPSPFFDYCLASIYNHIDAIVVLNSGWDFPRYTRNDYPLPEISEQIKRLDVNGKIHEVTKLDESKLFGLPDAAETMGNRAIAATLANDAAGELGADWVLWIASDQVFYDAKPLRRLAEQTVTDGFQFYEHKSFWGSQWWMANDATCPYSESDGAKFYRYRGDHGERQWFKGEGGIMNYRQQTPSEACLTGHMRECYPAARWELPQPKDFLAYQLQRGYFYFRDQNKVLKRNESNMDSYLKGMAYAWNVWQRANPKNLRQADPIPQVLNAENPEGWIREGK